MMSCRKSQRKTVTAKQPLWSPVLTAILTCVGSHRWWKMTCAAMQPWLLRMHLSLRGHDTWPVRFHTVSGLLTVNRDHDRFEMDFPSRPAVSCEIPTGLLSALGLEMAEVMRDPRDFLIVVDHAEIVRNLKPDIAALAKIDMGISGGAIVTASGDNDVDYVCRFFAPSEGIDEDAATGSIQCTLVPYWAGRTGKQTFRVQQLSSRGARMWCTLVGDRIKIAGEVKLYLQGTINI